MPRRLPAAVLVCLALGLAAAGCQPQVRETSTETIRRPAAPSLGVRLDRGSVSVEEHAGPEVEIRVERSARALSREAARSALEALVVEVRRDEGGGALLVTGGIATAGVWRPGQRLALHLEIAVPEGVGVEVRTGAGRIELRGLSGAITAMTVAGRITASALRSATGEGAAPIRLRSGGGRIVGADLLGRVHAETGDGRIRLAGRLQEVTAISADGRIEVLVEPLGPPLLGEWLLKSASGRIRLTLPRDAEAALSAVASEDADEEPGAVPWERLGPAAFAFLGGGGGPRIRLRADRGSAEVRIGAAE